MKNILYVLSLFLLFSCNNQPAEKKNASGIDFLKDSKPPANLIQTDPKAPVENVTLTAMGNSMSDMKFDKDTIRVHAGNTIEFTLDNQSTDGSMEHNFVLVENGSIEKVAEEGVKAGVEKDFIPDSQDILVHSGLTKPKSKSHITFKAPPKGTYEFVCTYPGHASRMRGIFIAE